MTTKTFHLGDLLSITTQALVSPTGMDGVHQILDFLVGEPLWTHQLPRACDECAPELLQQFPFLAEIEAPTFRDEAHVFVWLAEQCDKYGTFFEVSPLAAADHTSIDPLAELKMIAPDMPVIPIQLPDVHP